MALGLGQRSAQFSSPDFPAGTADYSALAGVEEDHPFVTGPAVGGMADTTGQITGSGAVHVSTGANPGANVTGRHQHWSNLFDVKNGPLFWLMAMTILYLGLLTVNVSYRIGRR